jgi:molybdopterin-guanine dinucleotide biosynthesis protein
MRATVVAVSGFSSNVGKTTVLCNLLKALPGWEAIKVTRGHHRSCGKDTVSCCVSSMLDSHPVVLSDRADTCAPGKDTGRYWEAGAAMVHWVIGIDAQIEEGIRTALARVEHDGVLVEGGSFLKYVDVDYSLVVASPSVRDIKSSALAALRSADALVINNCEADSVIAEEIKSLIKRRGAALPDVPIYFESDIPRIASEINRIHILRSLTHE